MTVTLETLLKRGNSGDKVIDVEWKSKTEAPFSDFTHIKNNYEKLDEDELFDYEKELITFKVMGSRYTQPITVEAIEEDNHLVFHAPDFFSDNRNEVAARANTVFAQHIGHNEYKYALEAEVYEVEEQAAEGQLSRLQLRIPKIYSTSTGRQTVFTALDGTNKVIDNGVVYDIDGEELTVNEELTRAHGGSTQRPQRTQGSSVMDSPAFRAIQEALRNVG